MVRSYLIENRIRFNSDSGSGGGGSDDNNPNADAARTQDAAAGYDNNNNNNDDNNISNIFGGAEMSVPTPRADQEFEAFLNNQPEVRFSPPPPSNQDNNLSSGLSPDDIGLNAMLRNAAMQPPPPPVVAPPVTMDDDFSMFETSTRFAGDQSRGGRGTRPLAGLTREQQRDLEQRDDMVARNIIAAQTQQPSGIPTTDLAGFFADDAGRIGGYNSLGPNLPFFGQTQFYTGRPGLDPNNSMSVDEQLFYDQRNGADEPLVRALQARQEEAPIDEAPPVSDDLAVNYLQNPFYAYSGFGNQYNPYGYATGTLVDLLQTRNMTQPGQADTMGLFGNPRDFT